MCVQAKVVHKNGIMSKLTHTRSECSSMGWAMKLKSNKITFFHMTNAKLMSLAVAFHPY